MSQLQRNSASADFSGESRIGLDAIDVFSTCPQSTTGDPKSYRQRVIEVARWSERIGCRGILVYTDNSLADPWLVSQIILEHTATLAPLVAVQPIYMHPYTAAKKVATLGFLYGRRVYLNMLAGGFRNDLSALGDDTPHDQRYARTVEYTTIIRQLLESPAGISFEGKYYHVHNLKMSPSLPPSLQPGILISGSSDAGMAAAHAIGATAIKYPLPPNEERGVEKDIGVPCGVRVGIVSRSSAEQAWRAALERFPETREGQLTHHLAMKVSDSDWHKQLSSHTAPVDDDNPYWLGPFHNYQTFCPYLVGCYERVAREIASYVRLGYRTFILDIPPSEEELEHTAVVFREALESLKG
ncbi:LLM class flavin-dependent oxidoreductase [Methylocaldum sp. BRCS4]|uniref:LLM class flavin-dependent oxidoreductase n=1 Tax=Methylocaldum sp. GT1TLB TaxID=3438965 RepID=UPI0012EC3A9E|nr:LLM class flavin-dependent oxidoreductase [Methylocaldum sp. BRCS4]